MEIAVKNYIEQNIEELQNKLYPIFTTDLDTLSVAYKFIPVSGGHLKQSQLELKIIDAEYDVCKRMEKKITELLDMEEDVPFVNYAGVRFHSSIAGGGTLFNDGCQRWEDTLYFMIDWRKNNVI